MTRDTIGSKDPDALKIPARRAEDYLTRDGSSPFPAEPRHDRFPEDFMFRLSTEEAQSLRSHIVISNAGRGGRRYLPYVFSEHGVAMLSSVLKSKRALQMNILIIRAFVKLREILATHKDLAARMEKLETAQKRHASVINILVEEIEELKQLPPEPPKRRIGFQTSDRK